MMNIFNNLILSLAFTSVTVLTQFLFFSLHEKFSLQVSAENYFITTVLIFSMSFIRHTYWRYLSMGFILILSLFQMIHLEFYGLYVYPHEIWLLFTQVSEITGTLKEDIYIFLRPFLLVFPSLILLWIINIKFPPKHSFKNAHLFFIALFFFFPARTALTGNTWGKIPTVKEFNGTNIYSSLSYFLGRILPARFGGADIERTEVPLSFKKENEGIKNIIFVIGESQSPYQMGLFGYEKQTTPFLNSLKGSKNFYHSVGVASGVMTDIALSFLVNNTFGLSGHQVVRTQKRCLFKLAKDNGYKTHFLSAQSLSHLKYIKNNLCPDYIDNFKTFEDISTKSNDENAVDDHELLGKISNIDFDTDKNFIILHQRGSHSPYSIRYPVEAQIFKPAPNEIGKSVIVKHYDNSTYYLDQFFKKLITKYKETTVFYVSDHGEGLGKDNIWGHGMLNRASTDIPIFIYSKERSVIEKYKSLPLFPTHLNMTLMISNLLGYKTSIPYDAKIDYTVLGADIDGFAGWADIKREEESFKLDVYYY